MAGDYFFLHTCSFTEIVQLKEALARCVQQMEQMQKEFAARSQPAQPGTMPYPQGQFGVQGGYGQQASPGMTLQVVMPTL